MAARLHLVCGLPGAGKTTLARSIAAETGAVRLAPDEWLLALGTHLYDAEARRAVEALQWRLALQLLARGVDVICENGFWVRAERDALRGEAEAVGATAILHFCDAPLAEIERRIAARNAASGDPRRAVTLADLAGWAAAFERPGADELAPR